MKRKLLSTVIALSMTATMAMPAFAATPDTQTSTVPVIGKIGRWQAGNTDPSNPGGTGGSGENGEVTPPTNVTDINVTIPTSMTFNVVTNTADGNPEFTSAEYKVVNNGTAEIAMSGEYDVTNAGDITLVDANSVDAKAGDGKIQLALSLKEGTTDFIVNVKDKATSTTPVTIAASAEKKLKFEADAQGMSDIKKEAAAGTFKDAAKTTQGNLVLTFTATTQP